MGKPQPGLLAFLLGIYGLVFGGVSQDHGGAVRRLEGAALEQAALGSTPVGGRGGVV